MDSNVKAQKKAFDNLLIAKAFLLGNLLLNLNFCAHHF